MDNYLMINGKKIELTEEQVKVLTEPKEEKKDVIHRVEKGSNFYHTEYDFTIVKDVEINGEKDKFLFENGNYYPLERKELAIQDVLHDKLRSRLRKFTRNHGWDEDVWENYKISKWCIIKATKEGNFNTQDWKATKNNDVYFMSEEIAEQAIEEVVKPFMEEHKEFIW